MSITREAKAKRSKSNNINKRAIKNRAKRNICPRLSRVSMTGSSDSDSVYYAGGKGKD